MAPTEDDIVRKIAALRRLAEKAGSPEEAASAAAKAQELLLTHNIAEVRVAGYDQHDLGAYINHEGIVVKQSWRQVLTSSVCFANYVRVVRCRDHSKAGGGRPWLYRMVGKKESIEACIDQIDWLAAAITRLAKAGYIDYALTRRMHGDVVEGESNWRHAFSCGAADTVGYMLRDLRRKSEDNPVQTKALLVIDTQGKEALQKFYPSLKPISQKGGGTSYNATAAGRAAGSSIQLTRPTGIGSNRKRLG